MKLGKLLGHMKTDYRRVIAGLVLLIVELAVFFGSGVLLEEEKHMLTGEGLWDLALTKEAPGVEQKFVPAHAHLESVSFRMDLSGLSKWDNAVTVVIEDKNQEIIFEKTLDIQEVTDCAYTEVKVEKVLSVFQVYTLRITATPTSAGEYPLISVCSREYNLPESRELVWGEELSGQHLVSCYQYQDALTAGRALKAIALCVIAALGVMVGLPKNSYVRKGAGAVLLVAAPYVLGQRLELLSYNPSVYLPMAMLWNLGIMYAMELLVFLATHSAAVSVVLTNVSLTVVYSANYFVRRYRGTSLRISDFTAIRTAAEVVGDYDLTPNSHMAFAWGILLVIVVFGVQTVTVFCKDKEKQNDRSGKQRAVKVFSYAATFVLAGILAAAGGQKLIYTDFLQNHGFQDEDIIGFQFEMIYSYNGYLVGTCVELKRSRIEMPAGYSVARTEEILSSAGKDEQETLEDLPHVILIMNESFTDIRVLGDMEMNQPCMPFWDSLKDNTVKGYVNTSVFGGGTANSEFEVLTGCNMAFLPVNYYPYQQTIREPVNSMVSSMKENGYTTIAMHPEDESNWNRKNVYQYLGFDKRLFQQDFRDAERIHSGVSDAETYKKIVELYENRQNGEKLFIFDLTMQNHGGYEQSEESDEVCLLNCNEPQIDEFLSLIRVSDDAFADLVGYFAGQKEKVIICMFGDHQPWITDLLVEEDMTLGGSASEKMMNKYRTPFVIWANYDIEEETDCDISLNYLGGMLMRTAGLSLSPYFSYLEKLRKEYPILTINGYVDSRGTYHGWSGGEFEDYRMLQYNYLFDENTIEWGY